MPSYPAVGAITALYHGDQIALVNNGAVDTGVTKTIPVAIAQLPGLSPDLTLANTTSQTITIQVSWHDVDADYEPLKDDNTGLMITAAANTTIVFECTGPLLRCTLSTAATAGSVVLSR
jgi:hypothetical protein